MTCPRNRFILFTYLYPVRNNAPLEFLTGFTTEKKSALKDY